MKTRKNTIPTYFFLAVFALFIAGLVLGSIFDLDIAMAISERNTDNVFGKLFETYGLLPFFISLAVSATLIGSGLWFLKVPEKYSKLLKILAIVLFVAMMAVATYFLYDHIVTKTSDPAISEKGYYINTLKDGTIFVEYGYRITNKIVCVLVSFLIEMASAVCTFFLIRKDNGKELVRVGIIILFALFLQWLILHFVKSFVGRPRFRFLYGDLQGVYGDTAYEFQTWYRFAMGKNPHIDYFKSWPSGHSASTAAMFTLALLPNVMKKRFKFDNYIVFGCVFAFLIVMVFARINAGAHYLSDISAGSLLGALLAWLGMFVGERILPDKTKETPKEAAI